MRRILVLTMLLTLAVASVSNATTILINNQDGPNEGLNDTTPAAPVGGNPGTTLGQQRLNVFLKAADIWAGLLPDNVTIVVNAKRESFCVVSGAIDASRMPAVYGRAMVQIRFIRSASQA